MKKFWISFLLCIVLLHSVLPCTSFAIFVEKDREENGALEIHYLDIGQGAAVLVRQGEQAMLIDGGPDNRGTALQAYLVDQGINALDHVIVSHADADHIGGLDVIVTKFPCGNIIMDGSEKDDTNAAYRDLMLAIQYRRSPCTQAKPGGSFSLGEAVVTILGNGIANGSENNNSVCCLIQYGDTRFLFTGDAEFEREQTLCEGEIAADVYYVGHHGSSTSSSAQLLDAVDPAYAVISCGRNNPYGHPHETVLSRLRERNITVFRTDEQGTIVAVSDGKTIRWNTKPSETWQPGLIMPVPDITQSSAPPEENRTVLEPRDSVFAKKRVLNTNTKKYHDLSCPSVKEIKDKNKQVVRWSERTIQEAGYTQCHRCREAERKHKTVLAVSIIGIALACTAVYAIWCRNRRSRWTRN